MSSGPLLDIRDLRVVFDGYAGSTYAVNGVSLTVGTGEAIGIVGESGSGKSVTMLSLLRLLPTPPGRIAGGEAFFDGRDLLQTSTRKIRRINGAEIGMVFQDPRIALNPVISIGDQIMEPIRIHRGWSRARARGEALRLLALVQLPQPEAQLRRFPHELSGGMCQRVLIAIALSCGPKLLVADEPTASLDVTIQAQIVHLIRRLRRELGMSVIWISHDLALMAGLVDRVLVMYAGFIVESVPITSLYRNAAHPYTRRLLASAPDLHTASDRPLAAIDGQPPVLRQPPVGCSFAPRCADVMARCRTDAPPLITVAPGHSLSCWLPEAAGTAA